jgi:hypothetical protein
MDNGGLVARPALRWSTGRLKGAGGCASIDFRTDRRSVFLML